MAPEWQDLARSLRTASRRSFLEIFAGKATLSREFAAANWQVAPAIDILTCQAYDLLNPMFQAVVIGLLLEGRVALLHLAPPCASFSMAVNRIRRHAMKTASQPAGLPSLRPHQAEKVAMGNALADVAVKLLHAQVAGHGHWQFEQPASSLMWQYMPVRSAMAAAHWSTRDVCMDGAPWMKPTTIVASDPAILRLTCRCDRQHEHIRLRGQAPCGRDWTSIAGPYWPGFARAIVDCWSHLLHDDSSRYRGAAYRSAMLTEDKDLSMADTLDTVEFDPSGGRHRAVAGAQVAAGRQPRGRALPQLVPDMLGPEVHLDVALRVQHPLTRPPPLFAPVAYAVEHQPDDADELNRQRMQMHEALAHLAEATHAEADWPAEMAPLTTRPVLAAGGPVKNLAFMREIMTVAGAIDANLLVDFAHGLPMLGWAAHAPTQMRRDRLPEYSVDDLEANSEQQNRRLIHRTRASGDKELDRRAWAKTIEEVELGILSSPVSSLAQLGMPARCLVRRHGIWEQHGAATAPTVRVLDDFLEGGQNGTVGYQYTHRPANLDTMSATMRTMAEKYDEELIMFTSDFAKAFKQVPGMTELLHLSVIVQWDPILQQPAFLVPYTQVFGDRSTPVNCCHAMAVLGALPCEHCVDDMISMERTRTMTTGWLLWRHIADLCGWRVPDSKSPPPSSVAVALGAEFDLSRHSRGLIRISIHDARVQAISAILRDIAAEQALPCGLAGQIWGKLQHATTMLWGKFGAAKLRPFMRRQHEAHRRGLNPQLRSAIEWWLALIASSAFPREVPISPGQLPCIVSYSDGEGSGGVGVAILGVGFACATCCFHCRSEGGPPLLGQTPKEAEMHDIFEIEAVGPLIVLATWPRLLQGRRWIHFIDNAACQAAFVRGSSSVSSGDVIIGLAWQLIARRRLLPWFDRVDTASNPVDGLSRGKRDGAWREVQHGVLPADCLRDLRRMHWD